MNWQLAIVVLIVVAAAVYLIRQTWRTWSSASAGCRGGCGCAHTQTAQPENKVTLIPADQLTLRRREGLPISRIRAIRQDGGNRQESDNH